jgi:serine/threonine protein kinase/WD40 repeat protein/tetratricopeptide (TPR) repeat protein
MSEIGCLSESELRAFVIGELPEGVVRLVSRHLETCPDCEAAARRLDSLADPFLDSLRLAVRPSSLSAGKLCASDAGLPAPALVAPSAQISHDTIPNAARTGSKPANAHLPAVPGFEILEELGRGGMGVVYRARQLKLGRVVALKMLLYGAHASTERRVRFRAEADAIARLQHPAILQVYDVGEHEGIPYLVLEYVSGGSLEHQLSGKPFPPRQAAELIETLAWAVDHAHRQGIIHRDLKPGNILLSEEWRGASGEHARATDGHAQAVASLAPRPSSLASPKIADFGLAKQASADLTSVGDVLGTPSYMAPEQAAGAAGKIGPAVDIYALGAILYELLTGRPPILSAGSLEMLEQVRTREPVAPSRLAAGIQRDLETICLKCLEKEPERRYRSAQALAEDLRRYLDGRPVLARPTGSWGRAWRWAKRNPSFTALIACLAGLLLISALGATALSIWAMRAEGQTREKLFESRISEARALSLGRRPGRRFKSLSLLDEARLQAKTMHLPGERLDELRNGVLAALVMADLYPEGQRHPLPSRVAYVDVDEGLTVYAASDAHGNCSVRRTKDDHEIFAIQEPVEGGAENWPFLSRDARFLAFRRADGGLQVWQLDVDPPKKLFAEQRVNSVNFHPTQAQIGFVHDNGAIVIHDLITGARINLPPDELSRDVAIALHPNEPLIAVASYVARVVKIRDFHSGELVKSLNIPGATAFHVAWHPAGHTLAISSSDAIRFIDRHTFACRLTFPASGGGGERLYFNHAGDRLATYGWNSAVHLYDVATGRVLFVVPNARSSISLHFSKDDRRLAGFLEENQLRFWQVGDAREYRTLVRRLGPTDAAYLGASVSDDNRLLAVFMPDGVGLWDLDSGNELEFLPLKLGCFAHFEPAPRSALLIGDATGTFRWPIRRDAAQPGLIRIGPPKALPVPAGSPPSQSQDGRVLAIACRAVGASEPWAGAWVFHEDRPEAPLHLTAGADLWNVSVSPDGRWLATSCWNYGGGQLWDATSGALVSTFTQEWASPQFSPDGNWLTEGGDQGRLLRAPDWRGHLKLGAAARFSPDSTMMALWTGTSVIRLVETATGRELARLEDPDFETPHDVRFTPDGSRIVIVNLKKGIHIWDLRLLRAALAERRLDWDAPPLTPCAPSGLPLRVEWDRGDYEQIRDVQEAANYDLAVQAAPTLAQRWYLRGLYRQARGQPEQASEDFRKALELRPGAAHPANALAWLLCTGPGKIRNIDEAVKLARSATERQPGEWNFHNTLGIALYRAGRLPEAMDELNTSLKGSAGQSDAFDLYFLAMASERLNDAKAAQVYYARAAAWHRAQTNLPPDQIRELDGFAAEAAKLLGRSTSSAPTKP